MVMEKSKEESKAELVYLVRVYERLVKLRGSCDTHLTHLAKQVKCQDCDRNWAKVRPQHKCFECKGKIKPSSKKCPSCGVKIEERKACPFCKSDFYILDPKDDPYIRHRVIPYLKPLEEEIEEKIRACVVDHPVWTNWAYAVKGLGLTTLAVIMGRTDIAKMSTASKFFAHCGDGLFRDGTIQRKVKGEEITYDAQLQSRWFLAGTQLLMAKGKYYEHKQSLQAKYLAQGLPEGQAQSRAFRHMRKLCEANLWEVWRKAEGLPAPEPYAFTLLNHDSGSRIRPEDMMEDRYRRQRPATVKPID